MVAAAPFYGHHALWGERHDCDAPFDFSRWFGVLAACSGPAAGNDPVALVEGLYQPYLHNQNPKLLEEAAPLTDELRGLMKQARDLSEQRDEPNAVVDFDPIVDAQDWQITDLKVELAEPIEGDHASVRATFKNMGEEVTQTFTLLKQGGGWRIDNIEGKHWTLRQLLADLGISAPE